MCTIKLGVNISVQFNQFAVPKQTDGFVHGLTKPLRVSFNQHLRSSHNAIKECAFANIHNQVLRLLDEVGSRRGSSGGCGCEERGGEGCEWRGVRRRGGEESGTSYLSTIPQCLPTNNYLALRVE